MLKNNQAKYAFYYLLSLVALIFMSIALGLIIFAIIDKSITDSIMVNLNQLNGQLRFAISTLIISTPIFYYTSHLIIKDLKEEKLSKDSSLRRWLTYLILFVSSLVIFGVSVSLINTFLSGGMTSRFILKALTIFLISLAVFSYYLYDIKREDFKASSRFIKIFFYSSLLFIVIVFISSWFFMESPYVARARLQDESISMNISNIKNSINIYYDRYQKLPDHLQSIENIPEISLDAKVLVNPETEAPIVYHKLGEKNYELCTSFKLASNNKKQIYRNPTFDFAYNHQAGYQCFPVKVYALIPPKL